LPLNSFLSLLSSFFFVPFLCHLHLPSIIYFMSLAAGTRGLALLMIDTSGFSALHRLSFYSVVFVSSWLAALDVLAAHQPINPRHGQQMQALMPEHMSMSTVTHPRMILPCG
jgi:hypothetical protein